MLTFAGAMFVGSHDDSKDERRAIGQRVASQLRTIGVDDHSVAGPWLTLMP